MRAAIDETNAAARSRTPSTRPTASCRQTIIKEIVRDVLEISPAHDPEFFTLAEQRRILERDASVRKTKSGCRFYLSPKAEPEKIIGTAALNNIVWGCFESCHLGYKLDQQYLNRGYMTQAVSAVAEYAFESLRLHRIEANVMPRNKRSLRVLEKCGFREEGLARSYLKINGVWEDHVHMVRLRDDPK
jgi:ribosomal-protein-alanine N-acetyltransferase